MVKIEGRLKLNPNSKYICLHSLLFLLLILYFLIQIGLMGKLRVFHGGGTPILFKAKYLGYT